MKSSDRRKPGAILRWILRDRRGSAAVEFGLSLPIYLTALFGVIEGGRLIYSQTALYFAAQEATRFAIVREGQVTNDEIKTFAEGRLIGLKNDLAVITVESPVNTAVNTSEYTVRISYNYTPMIPYMPNDILRLSASSRGFIAFPPVLPNAAAP